MHTILKDFKDANFKKRYKEMLFFIGIAVFFYTLTVPIQMINQNAAQLLSLGFSFFILGTLLMKKEETKEFPQLGTTHTVYVPAITGEGVLFVVIGTLLAGIGVYKLF